MGGFWLKAHSNATTRTKTEQEMTRLNFSEPPAAAKSWFCFMENVRFTESPPLLLTSCRKSENAGRSLRCPPVAGDMDSLEGDVGEQRGRREDGRDAAADVGDEGQNLVVLGVDVR